MIFLWSLSPSGSGYRRLCWEPFLQAGGSERPIRRLRSAPGSGICLSHAAPSFRCAIAFSFGLDAFGATVNQTGLPDGIFFAWLGQFQWVQRFSQFSWVQGLGQYPWVQRLGLLDSYAIFRSSFQYSDAPLLSLEQVSIGGRYSVRGYRENTMLRDRAALSSLEMRVPVIKIPPGLIIWSWPSSSISGRDGT